MELTEKPKITPLPIPPLLRTRVMSSCTDDRRGVTDQLLTLITEALDARDKKGRKP